MPNVNMQESANSANEEQKDQAQTNENQAIDTQVKKEDFERALNDMHKFKKQAKELEAKLKLKEEDELKKANNWQVLAEQKDREALEAKAELDQLRFSLVNEKKMSAIRDLALKHGLKNEALEDLDLFNFDEMVTIETTSTGRYNVLGADKAVQTLKIKRPHWFANKTSNINSSMPNTNSFGEKTTYEQVQKALAEAQKTGNYAEAQKLLMRYKKGE